MYIIIPRLPGYFDLRYPHDRILINRSGSHGAGRTEEERIRFYFATTLRRATNLIRTTVQKIGPDPSLNNVTAILDARSGLREAYDNMEDEIDEFINFDVEFIECPHFYKEY